MHARGLLEACRKVLMVALFAVLGGIASARAAETIEQKDVDLSAVRDPQIGAQVAIADFYGYFKDEGLNVTLHWTQSGADIITVMAGGSVYLGAASAFGRSLASSAVAVRTARNTARSVFGLPSIQLFAAIRTEWLYCSWSDIGSGSGLPET